MDTSQQMLRVCCMVLLSMYMYYFKLYIKGDCVVRKRLTLCLDSDMF